MYAWLGGGESESGMAEAVAERSGYNQAVAERNERLPTSLCPGQPRQEAGGMQFASRPWPVACVCVAAGSGAHGVPAR